MAEQPTLFGELPKDEEAKLGPVQLAVLTVIRQFGRVEPDEAGAIAHERRGNHGRDARCDYCSRDGRKILASLSKRGFKNGRPRREPPGAYDPSKAQIPF